MNAVQIRHDAMQAGVSITLNGDKLRLVSKTGILTPNLKSKLVKAKPEIIAMLRAEEIVATAIEGLPTTVDEIIKSPIFEPWDEHADMLADDEFDHQFIRQYIASWLLAGKEFPYLIKSDAAEQLVSKSIKISWPTKSISD